MLSFLYSFITFVVSLLLFPVFLFSARGRKNLWQRFGLWTRETEDVIWIHAASLGEVNALEPVIKGLRRRKPGQKILITTLSATGLDKARTLADFAFLAPFDSLIWYRTAFAFLRPRILLIAETEIWPALLLFARSRGLEVICVNGRISDYTFGKYRKLGIFLRRLLKLYTKILTISQESADRFIKLGAAPDAVSVTGYSKYDLSPAGSQLSRGEIRQALFGNQNPLVILGSLRPGEEEIWFGTIHHSLLHRADCNFIVAPRHQEKFAYFARQLDASSIEFSLYSETVARGEPAAAKVILLDAMGELAALYTAADLAFVGATLVDIGGHNPLEPAAAKAAVCLGPYYSNIKDIIEEMLEQDAAYIIKTREDAGELVKRVSTGDPAIKASAERAFTLWQNNNGASERIVNQIAPYLEALK